MLFDLDPPDGGFALAIRVAHLIREELERLAHSEAARRQVLCQLVPAKRVETGAPGFGRTE